LTAEGSARFAGDGETLSALDFDRLDFGRSRLRGVSVALTPSRPEISIGGGVLDAEPWLEDEGDAETPPAGAEGSAVVPPAAPDGQADDGGAEDGDDAILLSAEHLERVRL